MGSSLEPLEPFFYTHPLESSDEPVLIKGMGSYSGTALKREGPLNYKEKKATSMSNGSCSLWTYVVTRRPTQARSPTAVISTPRSSPTTPRCRLTRGTTPKRSLYAVSTVKKLSITVGTSVTHSGLEPYMCPECYQPSAPWGVSNPTRKPIPNHWSRTLPSGPSPFCSKKEIHNDLSLL